MPTSRIAIASGKGGTGKTTVAVNLAAVSVAGTALLDCDVEEPNVHLFIDAAWEHEQRINVTVPDFDTDRCDSCGRCREVCRFRAIVVLPAGPLLFPELCHGCGGCLSACPVGAITETTREVGTLRSGHWRGIHVVEGRIDVGEAKSPPMIEAVRSAAPEATQVIIDSPPGTSCPVMAAVRGVDYVVLVTEPTPFGLHDFRMAAQMIKRLGLPGGAVINRAGLGDDGVAEYCRAEGIPILAEIPADRRIAEVYSHGGVIVDELPEYRALFERLAKHITAEASGRDAHAPADTERVEQA